MAVHILEAAGRERFRSSERMTGYAKLGLGATTNRDWLLGLLVGLLILTIDGFIPYLGGLVRLVAVWLGLGAFAWQLYQGSRLVMTV